MFLVQTKTLEQRDAVNKMIEESGRDDITLAGDSYGLVESLDELYSKTYSDSNPEKTIVLKNTLHIWNSGAAEGFLSLLPNGYYFIASYELTEHELRDLYVSLPESVTMLLPVYGRIPLMYTKNCVKKTEGRCNKTSEFVKLKDRKKVYFPVYSDCEKCRNIIYNSVPLSLHNYVTAGEQNSHIFKDFYIEFTDESTTAVESILNYYLGNLPEFPITNYTTGHYKKSVL